ncbi:hypothetical protein Ahia01_001403400 [Argonauta hians]
MTTSRPQNFLCLILITWCLLNGPRNPTALRLNGNYFIASFKNPAPKSNVYVYDGKIVNASERRPTVTNADGSDTGCKSVVVPSYDETRYPSLYYNVQCVYDSGSSGSQAARCDQATKFMYVLKRNGCKGKVCSYKVMLDHVQTACVRKRRENLSDRLRFQPFETDVLAFLNNKTYDMHLEPMGYDEMYNQAECQWDWVRQVDENRFPRVFERAVCRNYTRCKLVYKEFVMLSKRNEEACVRGFCNYEPHIYNVPVACEAK